VTRGISDKVKRLNMLKKEHIRDPLMERILGFKKQETHACRKKQRCCESGEKVLVQKLGGEGPIEMNGQERRDRKRDDREAYKWEKRGSRNSGSEYAYGSDSLNKRGKESWSL